MPFPVYNTQESFHKKVMDMKKVNNTNDLFLDTKLNGSKKQGRICRFLNWAISLLPKIHIAQITPLKVAHEVYKFAETHQKFLLESDRLVLAEIVEGLKNKYYKYVQGKEKAIDDLVSKIRSLQAKTISSRSYEFTTSPKHENQTNSKQAPSGKIVTSPASFNQPFSEPLPQELIQEIISYAKDNDYENWSLVDREWHKASLEVLKRKEMSLIKKLVLFLIDLEASSQKKPEFRLHYDFIQENIYYLRNIIEHINFSNAETLSQLKISIFCEKIKILLILKRMYSEEKEKIQKLNLPWLFHDICSPEIANDAYILESIDKLIEKGQFEKIIEIESIITRALDYSDKIRQQISLKLIEKEQFEPAFKISERIKSYEGDCDKILGKISLKFIEKDQFETAFKISKRIKNGDILEKISLKSIEKGQFETAIKISDLMNSYCDDENLERISRKFKEKGQHKTAFDVSDRTHYNSYMYPMYFYYYLKRGNIKEVLQIAKYWTIKHLYAPIFIKNKKRSK